MVMATASIQVEYFQLIDNVNVVSSPIIHGHDYIFLNDVNLKRFLAGGKYSVKQKGYSYISDEKKEAWLENGTRTFDNNRNKKKAPLQENLFNWLKSGKFKQPDLANVAINGYWSDGIMEMLDGTRLVTGHRFDYLSGRMFNGTYDLEKAHAHLKTLPSVFELEDIDDVPSYNSSPLMNQQIAFWFKLPFDQYDLYFSWKKNLEDDGKYADFHEFVWEHDLLGLRGIGAAHSTTYYGHLDLPENWDHDD